MQINLQLNYMEQILVTFGWETELYMQKCIWFENVIWELEII